MDIFIQQLLNGLVLGSLYALIALGYTMVYGILRIINFAHGDVLMIGALIGLCAIHLLQSAFPSLPNVVVLIVATLIAMAACALLAGIIERVAYRRLRNAPRLAFHLRDGVEGAAVVGGVILGLHDDRTTQAQALANLAVIGHGLPGRNGRRRIGRRETRVNDVDVRVAAVARCVQVRFFHRSHRWGWPCRSPDCRQ